MLVTPLECFLCNSMKLRHSFSHNLLLQLKSLLFQHALQIREEPKSHMVLSQVNKESVKQMDVFLDQQSLDYVGGMNRQILSTLSACTNPVSKWNALILCLSHFMSNFLDCYMDVFHDYLLNLLNWILILACGWLTLLSTEVQPCLKELYNSLTWVFFPWHHRQMPDESSGWFQLYYHQAFGKLMQYLHLMYSFILHENENQASVF